MGTVDLTQLRPVARVHDGLTPMPVERPAPDAPGETDVVVLPFGPDQSQDQPMPAIVARLVHTIGTPLAVTFGDCHDWPKIQEWQPTSAPP